MGSQVSFRSFLTDKVPDSTWRMTVMTRLEPFFRIAADGAYPADDGRPPTDVEIHQAICRVFGLRVARFERISRRQAAFVEPRLELLTPTGSWRLGMSLGQLPPSLRQPGLGLRADWWAELAMLMGRDLFRALQPAVGADLAPLLADLLLQYVANVVAGHEDSLEAFDPLLRLLPRALPLGSPAKDPATWLVLVP